MLRTSEMLRLEADLKASEELNAKLGEAARRIAESGEAASDGEAIAKAASELGYAVTTGEVETVFAKMQELSEGELESVAGGLGGRNCPVWGGGEDIERAR